MRDLPENYLENMQKLLGGSFGEFLMSYEKPCCRGIRFNPLKASEETIEELISVWNLQKVPWSEYGYYYEDPVRPGLSAYHDAGVFYMQEPSAMTVAESISLNAADVVLDLCAAPGGKTTRLCERAGAVLGNEIIPSRAKILSSNIERMGYRNALVTQADSAQLADAFPEFFDAVFCDAPCSGEGMMRRDEIAVTEWSLENVSQCIERQKEILENAARLVCPGGKLIYSTCTFEPGEDEDQIKDFTASHPDFTILSEHKFWPHLENGEGHYLCVLQKGEEEESENRRPVDLPKVLKSMERRAAGAHIHILRSGLVPGENETDKKGRKVYVPSHAEVMASLYEKSENGVNFHSEELAKKYLRGEELRLSEDEADLKGEEGYLGVYFNGYPLGLGKRKGLTIKNHLPKGLRRF